MLENVTLVVVTYNEEENIRRCLESAVGVGEIVVVDSFSTDGTVDVARELGARIYQREYVSSADQKNWGIDKAGKEWILVLDADEALSPELREEIAAELGSPLADAYRIRRENEFMGKVIRHCGWGNDWVVRLFRKGSAFYPERTIHERLKVEGTTRRLKGSIFHRPYKDMDHYLSKLGDYARRAAEQMVIDGRGWFPGIVLNPAARFLRMYFLQLGFLDGWRGFVLCSLAATSVFYKYAFLMEKGKGIGRKRDW